MTMTRCSIVIPVYNADRYLDLCLLSILGQVTLPSIDVVCVPVGSSPCHIGAWAMNDERLTLLPCQENLGAALRAGADAAQGRYVLFMNQTDVITDVSNLLTALHQAEEKHAQVLLPARKQRLDVDAFSSVDIYSPRLDLLPSAELKQPLSPIQAGVFLLVLSIPTIFGNIYERELLSKLIHVTQGFDNVADLIISQVMLLRAQRISFSTITVVESRYENNYHPAVSSAELLAVEKKLTLQVALTISPKKAVKVARNVIIFYLAHILSSLHPYKRFRESMEHYKDLCRKLSNPAESDVTYSLHGCSLYLSLLSEADEETLIEVYSLPQRDMVFKGYSTRQPMNNDKK